MTDLPIYVPLTFLLTTLATFGFIYFMVHSTQTKNERNLTMIVSTFILSWMFAVAILSINEFFLVFDSMPPRFLLAIGVPIITIIALFTKKRTRAYIKRIPITTITYIHIIRVPVEIVLWWLFIGGLIPQALTFEGVNYDILAGISAPFVAIFMVGLRNKSRIGAILWNVLALGLLLNIVIRAVLSAPLPFQQFAFDNPQTAVFYFPYIWLPAFIVPIVLFSHLASLLKLFANTEDVR
jgi:hypothetical protein